MSASALELADLLLDLGYERGAAGELRTRDSDPRDVRTPAFHLVRTAEGNRWLTSGALLPDQRAALEAALRGEPVVPLAHLESTPPLIEDALARILPGTTLSRGPAFVFPDRVPAPAVEVVHVLESANLPTALQLTWVREAGPAAHPLCVARNSSGEVVAVCHSSRSLPNAAAAGVETAEAYRRAGLGTAVVAGWAAAVRDQGREPHYGTSWENAASRAIARKLALVMFAEEIHPG